LTFTYYFEELGSRRARERKKKETALFKNLDLGPLKGLRLPHSHILIRDGNYYLEEKNYPADAVKIRKILDILGNMEVVSVLEKERIPKNRSYFFPEGDLSFVFEFLKGDIAYQLGGKLAYSRDFYVEVRHKEQRELLVVRDATPQYGIYNQPNLSNDPQKYNRFKAILGLKGPDLYDLRPFKKGPQKLGNIQLESFRNKKFQVSFVKHQTLPMALKGISYNPDSFEDFENKLKKLTATGIHFDFQVKDLLRPLSTISGDLEGTLYNRYGKKNGHFLAVKGDKDLYELEAKDTGVFFMNAQDFWDKGLLRADGLKTPAIFSFKGKPSIKVRVKEGKSFEVEAFDGLFKLDQEAFKKIYSLMFKSAERVSDFDQELRSQLKTCLFDIVLNKVLFQVYQSEDELLFVNPRDKLVFVYQVGRESPIGLKFENYFKTAQGASP
jgi:hypothetical protein